MLKEVLRLPDSSEILSAHTDQNREGTLLLKVEDESFAPLVEGDVIPTCGAWYQTEYAGIGNGDSIVRFKGYD